MRLKYVLFLALALCLTGCTPVDCLHPLYTDKDVIYDQALLGDWVSVDPDNKTITRFTEMTEMGTKLKGYDITMLDSDGSSTDFHAHLVNLGGQHVLDAVVQMWDASSDSYALRLNQGKLEPRLLRLGMAAYMEFKDTGSGKIQAQLIPAHWFLKVTTDGKKLRLDYMDDEKLAKAIAKGDFHIPHALLGNDKDLVFTATTSALQQFVLQHIDDEKVFTDHIDNVRKP